MAYRSGSDGYVEIGGVRLDVTAWEAEETAEWAETSGTGSPGFREAVPVKKCLRGTVKALFDPAKGPKGAPRVAAGAVVEIALRTAGAESYRATANILQLRWVTPAGAPVAFAFDFESTGAFTYGA